MWVRSPATDKNNLFDYTKLSGRWESNPVYILPKDTYDRYTTARYSIVWAWRDLNSQLLRDTVLNRTRIPIPPHALVDPRRIELRPRPCHGRVIPLYYEPNVTRPAQAGALLYAKVSHRSTRRLGRNLSPRPGREKIVYRLGRLLHEDAQ